MVLINKTKVCLFIPHRNLDFVGHEAEYVRKYDYLNYSKRIFE